VANWRGPQDGTSDGAVYIVDPNCDFAAMIELLRTNDAVIISFVESLMRDAGIGFLTADQNMSVLDGSIGILPRRVLVESDRIDEARRILTDAGIADEIRRT
jgi:Putative prokaryotic signal transducing protein